MKFQTHRFLTKTKNDMPYLLNYKKRYLATGVIRYSLYSFLVMSAYMLILTMAGLGTNHWLYIGNVLILGSFIYKGSHQIVKFGRPQFLTIFIYGMLVAHLAAIFYALFVMIYLGLINIDLFHSLQELTPFGHLLNIYGAGIVVYITLAAGGTFLAYILTLFFLDTSEK
jgi:hypothetical protein